MNKISITGRILLSAFQSLIVIVGMWYAVFLYYADIEPNRQVEQKFIKTECRIVESSLSVKNFFINWYRANLKVSYSAEGPTYTADVLGYGVDRSFTVDKVPQQMLLKQFLVGNVYPCWYNPLAPHIVVLAIKHRFSVSFALFIDLLVVIFAFYSLVRNIFSGIAAARLSYFSHFKGKK